jgi:hypothetical protein
MKKSLRILCLIAAVISLAGFATADTVVDWTALESDPDLAIGAESLFGESGTWTTDSNLAALSYYLSLISGAEVDESQVPEILQPLLQIILEEEQASGGLTNDVTPGDQFVADNPEPATLVLLGGALALLCGYAAKRYGTRPITHQSDSS